MPIPRKLLVRVVGAPLLVAALCGVILWGNAVQQHSGSNTPVRVLVLLVAVICVQEICSMCAAKGISTAPWAGMLATAVFFFPWDQVTQHPVIVSHAAEAACAGLPLYLLVMIVFRYGSLAPDGAALTYLGFGYMSLLSYALNLPPRLAERQAWYLLFLLAAGKGSDMAAFVVGKSVGKHPMSPRVSPNKTWEGGIAGGIAGMAAGMAVIWLTPLQAAYPRVPVPALLFFCLLVTIASQVGDLVKSAFKRWAGVKDSGRILPEFGGMLDMVDSFIIAAPVATMGSKLL
ncbi:MAG TPA: phosphatidate cytidylyltransferase, partial [Planctomycetota bacterium]|nr:phosphatidate cytidylyltransferase [Planctomycetota bacterium]